MCAVAGIVGATFRSLIRPPRAFPQGIWSKFPKPNVKERERPRELCIVRANAMHRVRGAVSYPYPTRKIAIVYAEVDNKFAILCIPPPANCGMKDTASCHDNVC